MHTINARNVAEALPLGINYLVNFGEEETVRGQRVLVAPGPVTTAYRMPQERVLLSAVRDANPFFHLAESLWMLAGRNDAAYLDQFVKDFGARFAEPTGMVHGAYGFRWRYHWDFDQLQTAIHVLRQDPFSRQAVISMWDPDIDLDKPKLKDRPCNTHIYLRINQGRLDMTVCCRSNDVLWGAYGANAVHFSVLQEYLATYLSVAVGTYYQVSNNFHVYLETLQKHHGTLRDDRRFPIVPLISHPDVFDEEVELLLSGHKPRYNRFLAETAYWMLEAYLVRSVPRDVQECLAQVQAEDWRTAGQEWVARRNKL